MANKRDRITVYPSAATFEFATAAELSEALSRGLPAVKITDRLAVVPREQDIDYKHFRLTGTRDYACRRKSASKWKRTASRSSSI